METRYIELCECHLGELLDLPMRDGNAGTSVGNYALFGAFRPSYEGWKLKMEILTTADDDGF